MSFATTKSTKLAVVLTPAILCQCGCRGIQSALDPAGPQSRSISGHWWLLFWVCTVVFVLVVGFMLYGLWRSKIQTPNDAPVDPAKETRTTWYVSACVVATVVILFVFLVASLSTAKTIFSKPGGKPLEIEVTGHQWWWEVRYPDPDSSKIVVTANEIHIPAGQPVHILLKSADVIHSFWVPKLQGKMDLIPMHSNSLWMQADFPGVYRGQCAEFCGHQHAHMSFLVIAEPLADFNQWRDQQIQSGPPPADPVLRKGQHVFLSSSCVLCHTLRGTTASATLAPDLTHFASRHTIAAGTLSNDRASLERWIVNSQGVKPGNKMPPNDLNPEDLQNLLSYLGSLK